MGAPAPAWSFRPEYVIGELRSANAIAVLEELIAPLVTDLDSGTRAAALAALREREKLGSTAMGNGVAIPHAKIAGIDALRVGFGRHVRGVDFGAPDGQPVHLFFVILSPADTPGVHLQALAQIARMTSSADVRQRLVTAPSEELVDILNEALRQAASD